MEENLEVFFCDLCNTSVPQHDLNVGAAVRVKGRVIGACCVAALRGTPSAPRPAAAPLRPASSGSGVGLLAATVIVLAAVAASTMFLELRQTEEVERLGVALAALHTTAEEAQDRLRVVEEGLGGGPSRDDLERVRDQVADLGKSLQEREIRLQGSMSSSSTLIEQLGRAVEAVKSTQQEQTDRLRNLRDDFRSLGVEVAAAMARPRAEPMRGDDVSPGMMEPAVPEPAVTGSGLSPELEHQIGKLADADPGTRFEAVDKLVQSENPAVLDALIPMTKDNDAFVRRLTVEGLAVFHDARCVEILLTTLADPESIVRHAAYGSLRKLTAEKIAFDPDGKQDERRSGQRKWQDWWRKNRDKF